MKKDFIQGYFLIAAAIITPVATWILTSNNYKIEIQDIKDSSVDKEVINETYVEKNKYDNLKQKEVVLSDNIEIYKNEIDSLSRELRYIKIKYNKIAKIPNPAIKLEVDNTLFEIEKAYQSGKYIVADVRITNLGNDKEYGLDRYNTVVKTDDGRQYEVKDILKGGNNAYRMKSNIFNKEEVFYSIYFGDISSQLKYDNITFRSITTDKTAVLQRVTLSRN
jgi:hypothetical protein